MKTLFQNKHKKIIQFDIINILIGIWIVAFMLSTSMLSVYSVAGDLLHIVFLSIRIILIGLAIIDCFYHRQSIKRVLMISIYMLMVVVEYLVSDNWLLFELFFIYVFWADRLNYKVVLKIFMYITGAMIAFIALLFFAGVLIQYDYYTNRMGRPRVTLGFHHPNSLSACLMVVLLCMFLLFWKRNRRIIVAGTSLLVLMWIAYFPNTLTVVLTVPLVYIIYGILRVTTSRKTTKWQKKIIRVFTVFLFVAIVSSLYYIVNSGNYDNAFSRQFESLLIRIRLSRLGLERYGISLFGTVYESATEIAIHINKTASEYFTIDSVYFLLPIRYGIATTLLFFFFYYQSIKCCVRKDNIKLLSVLIAVLVMSIVDPFVTNYIMSFIFICSKAYTTEDKF